MQTPNMESVTATREHKRYCIMIATHCVYIESKNEVNVI